MLHGSCLCGQVRYEYTGDLGPIAMCHCTQCRRAQGSAFGTNSPVQAAGFQYLSGRDSVKEFEGGTFEFRKQAINRSPAIRLSINNKSEQYVQPQQAGHANLIRVISSRDHSRVQGHVFLDQPAHAEVDHVIVEVSGNQDILEHWLEPAKSRLAEGVACGEAESETGVGVVTCITIDNRDLWRGGQQKALQVDGSGRTDPETGKVAVGSLTSKQQLGPNRF